jgi:hypothetical protein
MKDTFYWSVLYTNTFGKNIQKYHMLIHHHYWILFMLSIQKKFVFISETLYFRNNTLLQLHLLCNAIFIHMYLYLIDMANITVIMCSSANKELNWIEYFNDVPTLDKVCFTLDYKGLSFGLMKILICLIKNLILKNTEDKPLCSRHSNVNFYIDGCNFGFI